jgi:hypothetical protein
MSNIINFPSEEERLRCLLLQAIEELKESHRMLYIHQEQVMMEEREILKLARKYECCSKDPDPFIIEYLLKG